MAEGSLDIISLGMAAVLALVHLFAGRLRFLEGIPRSRWLSIAGGVAVAYVFVHMLPELGARQDELENMEGGLGLSFLEHHVYLLALLGLTVFYGLEQAAVQSRPEGKGGIEAAPPSIFWLHLVSYSFYNLIVGYLLLHRDEGTWWSLFIFFIAMALHFLVNDFGLREHHKQRYHALGRWVLSGAVLMGWATGVTLEVSTGVITVLFAFLAGGIILNVLKEELPEKRKSRFSAFVFGATLYTALLLIGG